MYDDTGRLFRELRLRFYFSRFWARVARRLPASHERCAIESWLSSHRTSPKTGAALQSTILIDSHGVKQLIADFLDETRRLQAAIDASDADETKAPS